MAGNLGKVSCGNPDAARAHCNSRDSQDSGRESSTEATRSYNIWLIFPVLLCAADTLARGLKSPPELPRDMSQHKQHHKINYPGCSHSMASRSVVTSGRR